MVDTAKNVVTFGGEIGVVSDEQEKSYILTYSTYRRQYRAL
jgi:hypothetical protein